MQRSKMTTIVSIGSVLLFIAGSMPARADDCNSNGIPDQCDVDCGTSGGYCDVPGCGESEDCNNNGIPDECDIATAFAWSEMGGGVSGGIPGENPWVHAFTVYQGELIIGGNFTSVDGVEANFIARWDGAAWAPLGDGMNSRVEALTVYENDLIAGGYFTIAGGGAANLIARWDGASWSPLGDGLTENPFGAPYCAALEVFNGELIAGGGFVRAGGDIVNGIARWDGSSWLDLGQGTNPNGPVLALTVFDGALYAAGDFSSVDGVPANRIARWDGPWSALGSGINSAVWSLGVYDDGGGPALYAGGRFTSAGGVPVNRIARWDGSQWWNVGGGVAGIGVNGLIVFDDGAGPGLYAGGQFTDAGSVPANNVARWDGSVWSPLADGVDAQLIALGVHGGTLFAGGQFVFAGDVQANGVARWESIGTSFDSNSNGIPDECEGMYLDIKPGSCPNPLNRESHGVLPVALLGTADFDAVAIDVPSVRLGRADGVGGLVAPHEGPPGPHSVFADVGTPFEGEMCDCHEAGADGFVDLSMKFKTDDVVADLLLDDLDAGALVELVVTGELLDGIGFAASDCVRLVPPGTPPGLLSVQSSMAGAWIDVDPPDETLDAGGFAGFQRGLPLSTVVTLTAEEWADGRPLRGWQIGGLLHHMGEPSIEFALDQDMTVRAVYGPTPSGGTKPPPTGESFPEPTQGQSVDTGTIGGRS